MPPREGPCFDRSSQGGLIARRLHVVPVLGLVLMSVTGGQRRWSWWQAAGVAGRRPTDNTRSLTLGCRAAQMRTVAPDADPQAHAGFVRSAVPVLPPLGGEWIAGGTRGAGQDCCVLQFLSLFLSRLISGDIDRARSRSAPKKTLSTGS